MFIKVLTSQIEDLCLDNVLCSTCIDKVLATNVYLLVGEAGATETGPATSHGHDAAPAPTPRGHDRTTPPPRNAHATVQTTHGAWDEVRALHRGLVLSHFLKC